MSAEMVLNVGPRETRAALLENGVLQELFVERASKRGLTGNLYKGKVSRVLPGMQAAFIDIGLERTAFLHVSDIVQPADAEGSSEAPRTDNIRELVAEGRDILVQVLKDPLGTKGARLTTFITIPSRYLVYMPFGHGVGVSARIETEAERQRLREAVQSAATPGEAGGYIVRTMAENACDADLTADIAYLRRLWAEIRNRAQAAQPQQAVSAQIGNVRVMSDDLNNSVLVWGTKTEYRKIETTLKRLDLPPTQVLIEASIIEVTLNDKLQYGLQWAFSDSRSTTDYTGMGTLTQGATKNQDGSIASLFSAPASGFSYTLKNSAGAVRALLTALSAKTSVKMVASPSLMVLENHQASITVGSQIPVQTDTTTYNSTNAASTSSVQWKDTGVNLSVTPSVNSGNLVNLQIDQTVTDVGGQDEITKQRSFLQRQLTSKVAVRSGESIIMGGLIQERSSESKAGIPVLHTVPVVGNLFGNTGNEGGRTELIVVLTPRVVRSDIDIRDVSDDLRARMKGLTGLSPDTIHLPPAPTPPANPITSQ